MDEFGQYVESFRQEAEDLLVEIEESLLILETEPNDMDTVGRLFRAMHTIKGSGAMFGFEGVAAFTHHVETALDRVRNGEIPITRQLIDLVLASRDQIALMIRCTDPSSPGDDPACQGIIENLSRLMSSEPPEPTSSAEQASAPILSADGVESEYRIVFVPGREIFATGTDPAYLLDELRTLGECEICTILDDLPSLSEMDPEQCYLSWEIRLKTAQDVNAIRDVFIFVEDSCRIEITPVLDPSQDPMPRDASEESAGAECSVEPESAPEKSVLSQASSTPRGQGQQTGASRNEMIKVPSGKLDALVNLVGELVINQAQLRQIAGTSDNPALSVAVEQVDRLTDELRDIALSIRMLPIGTSFGRFKRLVRDLSRELGKQIELVTEGEETELDKTVIDRLADPLVHLIRNSIDHGIEAPDIREMNGKPRHGTIMLTAAHRGASVIISISDDGKGIDAEAVRAKAASAGLISADQDLSEKELFALIFAPGFSTASAVTSVSGRGVGMDVVRKEIDALGGSVSVSSRKGQGTVIELSLPLTLAIVDGLLVEVGGESFVAPLSAVEACLELTDSDLAVGRGRNVIHVRGEVVPFIRLRDLFDTGGAGPERSEVVIVNHSGIRLGVVVDRVIGDHQTVIKSLGSMYRDIDGVSGATILGDGTVALILDIEGLIHCAEIAEHQIVNRRLRVA